MIFTFSLGPQNGENLLVVLSEVENVSKEISPLFCHTLNCVLLNPKGFGVNEMTRLFIVAKYAFEMCLAKEKTKWTKEICNIILSEETRNALATLNISIPKDKIVEHILQSVSILRLKELLHESENVVENFSTAYESGEPLFYLDSGKPKMPSNDGSEEMKDEIDAFDADTDDSSEEPLQFIDDE